jgi:hypothetical protein
MTEERQMNRSAFSQSSLVVVALAIAAAPALAQDPSGAPASPARSPAVEVTPFVSMGSLGSSRIGAAAAFPVTDDLSVEAEMGYRRGEGDINALNSSVSLLFALPRLGAVTPYLAAGGGLEEYGTPVSLPGRSGLFTQSKLAFAVNTGGGVKVPVDDRWSLRSDARWYKALGRNGPEHWRLYQSATFGVGRRAATTGDR